MHEHDPREPHGFGAVPESESPLNDFEPASAPPYVFPGTDSHPTDLGVTVSTPSNFTRTPLVNPNYTDAPEPELYPDVPPRTRRRLSYPKVSLPRLLRRPAERVEQAVGDSIEPEPRLPDGEDPVAAATERPTGGRFRWPFRFLFRYENRVGLAALISCMILVGILIVRKYHAGDESENASASNPDPEIASVETRKPEALLALRAQTETPPPPPLPRERPNTPAADRAAQAIDADPTDIQAPEPVARREPVQLAAADISSTIIPPRPVAAERSLTPPESLDGDGAIDLGITPPLPAGRDLAAASAENASFPGEESPQDLTTSGTDSFMTPDVASLDLPVTLDESLTASPASAMALPDAPGSLAIDAQAFAIPLSSPPDSEPDIPDGIPLPETVVTDQPTFDLDPPVVPSSTVAMTPAPDELATPPQETPRDESSASVVSASSNDVQAIPSFTAPPDPEPSHASDAPGSMEGLTPLPNRGPGTIRVERPMGRPRPVETVPIPGPSDPRSLPRPPAATPATMGAVRHQVQRGENFYTISRLYYGSGRYWKALWSANRGVSPVAEDLAVGTTIQVPPPEKLDRALIVAEQPPEKPAQDTSMLRTGQTADGLVTLPSAASGVSKGSRGKLLAPPIEPASSDYLVQSKYETLRTIARDTLGDPRREEEIRRLNLDLLSERDRLVPGMRLRLPPDALDTRLR